MLKYKIYQDQSTGTVRSGKYYARTCSDQTIDLDKLALHMANHHTPFSIGTIRGVMSDMVSCIKELVLEGYSVKVDDLAIFSVGISCKGAEKLEDFSVDKNVIGLRLKARATGNLAISKLKLEAQLRHADIYVKPGTTLPDSGGSDGGNDGGSGGDSENPMG